LRVVINIEANGLLPTHIWWIVCKDIDTGKIYRFKDINNDGREKDNWERFAKGISYWIGHNLLGYDFIHLNRLTSIDVPSIVCVCCDSLIISKLSDYPRQGHSTTHYAKEFGIDKPTQPSYVKFSEELGDYCELMVEIGHKIYLKYKKYIDKPSYQEAIKLEYQFQLIVNELEQNGFCFNAKKAEGLLDKVTKELVTIDKEMQREFPPKTVVVREFTPRLTKFGTISKTSIPRPLHENIHEYEADKIYALTKQIDFNPSSHKQLIEVLHEAGWKPIDKTATHLDLEREINQLKRNKSKDPEVALRLRSCYDLVSRMEKYGWKINETNLATLPEAAPASARVLAQRILLEARRRTLTEWIGLVQPDGRIHGRYYGLGAWSHRMSHQKPNTANIPNEFDTAGKKKLLGKEMRSLWCAPKGRLLVGVDAEGIQLRIFAHYIDDPEFTKALVEGRKDDKTDPHSLNQRILGDACRSRAAAKRFIYALLLGAGMGKLSEILGCSSGEAQEALDRLLVRYTGWKQLKDEVFSLDARRGYFIGLDGRAVRIPGDTQSNRRHLAMSGYLQNGEAVIMKKAAVLWKQQLIAEGILDWLLVNFVHDEWQTEVPNNMKIALRVAEIQADSLRIVGEQLKLKCPLAGSYYNDDIKDYTIATNWAYTH